MKGVVVVAPRSVAKTGFPAQPNEIKRRRGNPGKRALPKEEDLQILPAAKETPKPPRPLGKIGKAFWDRVWSAGAVWLSPDTDIDMVLMCAELLDERAGLRDLVASGGDRFERSALRVIDKQIVDMYQLLGLTPTDRSRLGMAEVRIEDELEEFRRQHGRSA